MKDTKSSPICGVKHGFFKSSFFPLTIIEWNNLDYSLHNVFSTSALKQNILRFSLRATIFQNTLNLAQLVFVNLLMSGGNKNS